MQKLEQEGAQLKTQVEVIEEEFRPKIRLAMKDSSIELQCQFYSPYDQIKLNKTRINTAFLDAVAKEKKIEIAYPHMQLVLPSDAAGKPKA